MGRPILNVNEILKAAIGLTASLVFLSGCADRMGQFQGKRYTAEQIREWKLKNTTRDGGSDDTVRTRENEQLRRDNEGTGASPRTNTNVDTTGAGTNQNPNTQGRGQNQDGAQRVVHVEMVDEDSVVSGNPTQTREIFLELANQELSRENSAAKAIVKAITIQLVQNQNAIQIASIDAALVINRGHYTLHTTDDLTAGTALSSANSFIKNINKAVIELTPDGSKERKDLEQIVSLHAACKDLACNEVIVALQFKANGQRSAFAVLEYKKNGREFDLIKSNLGALISFQDYQLPTAAPAQGVTRTEPQPQAQTAQQAQTAELEDARVRAVQAAARAQAQAAHAQAEAARAEAAQPQAAQQPQAVVSLRELRQANTTTVGETPLQVRRNPPVGLNQAQTAQQLQSTKLEGLLVRDARSAQAAQAHAEAARAESGRREYVEAPVEAGQSQAALNQALAREAVRAQARSAAQRAHEQNPNRNVSNPNTREIMRSF